MKELSGLPGLKINYAYFSSILPRTLVLFEYMFDSSVTPRLVSSSLDAYKTSSALVSILRNNFVSQIKSYVVYRFISFIKSSRTLLLYYTTSYGTNCISVILRVLQSSLVAHRREYHCFGSTLQVLLPNFH